MRFLLITQDKIRAHHLHTVFLENNNVLDIKYEHCETFRAYPKYKESYNPQAVILDVTPYSISVAIRFLLSVIKWASHIPVVSLTRDCWQDKVLLLRAGAVDCHSYIEDARLLSARLDTITRRNHGFFSEILKIEPFQYDLRKRKFSVDGFEIKLTPFESLIIEVLMRNKGRVLNKAEILLQFRMDPGGEKNHSFEVIIARLRQKISVWYPDFCYVIRNIRGQGYIFEVN